MRNRGRTAPAVAAVLAAVAGTVAVGTYDHSMDLQARHEYVADLPGGSGLVELAEDGRQKDVPAVREALGQELPVAVRADVEHVLVGTPGCEARAGAEGCGEARIIRPKDQRCPLYETEDGPAAFSREQQRQLRFDWRCAETQHSARFETVVADEKLLTALAVTDPGTVSALTSGQAVSFDRRNVKDGKVTLRLITGTEDHVGTAPREDPTGEDKVFAVHQAPDGVEGWGVDLVLPPAAARSAGLATLPYGSYFTLDGTATGKQRQKLAERIDRIGVEAPVLIESGYQGRSGFTLPVLTVFAALVTIGAAGIATGLAQADAESDLKTLAAVGAPPRVRRTLSAFQCAVVALMGVVLGIVSGLLPAVGLRLALRRETAHLIETAGGPRDVLYVPIALPWGTFAALLVLVPLGAGLLAALVTRSSGTYARRAVG